MAECPAKYTCFNCKKVGDHWIMQCPVSPVADNNDSGSLENKIPKRPQNSNPFANHWHQNKLQPWITTDIKDLIAEYDSFKVEFKTYSRRKKKHFKHQLNKLNGEINEKTKTAEQQWYHQLINQNSDSNQLEKIAITSSLSDLSATADEFIPQTIQLKQEIYNPFIFIYQDFENEIETFYTNTRSSQSYITKQNELFQCVSQCILLFQRAYSPSATWDIFIFGGNVWEIDSKHSDMDMAIDLNHDKVSRHTKQHILKNISKTIKEHVQTVEIEDILHARYPIICIKDQECGVKIDLSVSDEFCQETSQFILNILDSYSQEFCVPIRKFIIFVKFWSKQCGINDALNGYLNSFGFTLMTIKYIQCVIYCERFIIGDIRRLSCLIFGFFFFYGYTFDHTQHSIDIMDIEYETEIFSTKKTHCLLEIVDPINKTNNVAKNVRNREYLNMQYQLQKACQIYSDFIKQHESGSELCLFELLTASCL